MKRIIVVLLLVMSVKNLHGQIQWTNVFYLTITGQTLQKVGNVRTDWNAGAISQQNFYNDGWVEFRFPSNKYAMMGFGAFNTSVSPSSIKYAIYAHINGYLYVYENGSQLPNIGKYKPIHPQFTATDVLRVERSNGIIYYKKNGVTFYTSTIPSSGPLHVDCSFMLANAAISVINYMFGLEWTGAQNESWNEPGNWNLNRVPTVTDHVIVNACSTCPKLSSPVNVGTLQLNNGSALDLDNHSLTVQTATIINSSKLKSNEGIIRSKDFVEMKNSAFNGGITLEKSGGTLNNCYGGNIFSPKVKILNSSTNTWNVSTQAQNIVKNL